MLMDKSKLQEAWQFFVPAFPLILYTKHKTCHNPAKKQTLERTVGGRGDVTDEPVR